MFVPPPPGEGDRARVEEMTGHKGLLLEGESKAIAQDARVIETYRGVKCT